jgi:hypothetical protein
MEIAMEMVHEMGILTIMATVMEMVHEMGILTIMATVMEMVHEMDDRDDSILVIPTI